MKLFITTTFSPGMLKIFPAELTIVKLLNSKAAVRILDEFEMFRDGRVIHATGHGATAAIAYQELSIINSVEFDPKNRPVVAAEPGDEFLVFQYFGPRLEEGQILTREQIAALWAAEKISWLWIAIRA